MLGSPLAISEIQVLDKEINQLMDCKPLTEADVKQLCDKVIEEVRKLCLG